jgi:hypothetical protein
MVVMQLGIRNSNNHTENTGRVVLAIYAWRTGKVSLEAVNQENRGTAARPT